LNEEARVMETATSGKIAELVLTTLLFIGLVGGSSYAFESKSSAKNANGIVLKEEYEPGSYCHQKLPAITESSLAGNHPVVSQSETIDFYGPCNENPVGAEQVTAQRIASADRKSK
jgi:hypothetical protein